MTGKATKKPIGNRRKKIFADNIWRGKSKGAGLLKRMGSKIEAQCTYTDWNSFVHHQSTGIGVEAYLSYPISVGV